MWAVSHLPGKKTPRSTAHDIELETPTTYMPLYIYLYTGRAGDHLQIITLSSCSFLLYNYSHTLIIP